jgi:hypothetical protein
LNAVSQRIVAGMLTPDQSSKASIKAGDHGSRVAPRVPDVNSHTSNTPALLAAAYPPASRAEAQHVFADLLDKYRAVERAMEIPERDLSGAIAMLIAGSYEAYNDVSIEPEQFKAMSKQLRQVLGTHASLASATTADKRQAYEQMAILGMLLSGVQDELSRHPDAAIAVRMKLAAKGYLEQFLKTDADRVQITAQGLVIR